MAYRLKSGAPVGEEIHRNIDKQLGLAVSLLQPASKVPSDSEVHEARRHVKKARTLLRLIKPVLGRDYRLLNERLRSANRMLAPIADGEAVVETLSRLRQTTSSPGPAVLHSIRQGLVQREVRIDERARIDKVVETAADVLRAVQRDLRNPVARVHGFRSIEPGLRRSYRAARRGLSRAAEESKAPVMHAWRRRVKDHWLLLRLLEARCGNRLATDEREVESLDETLGELNNCDILRRVVDADKLVSIEDRPLWTAAVGKYRASLRAKAFSDGRRIYRETPKQFVRRVEKLWRAEKSHARKAAACHPSR